MTAATAVSARRASLAERKSSPRRSRAAPPYRPLDLDALVVCWQRSLDASQRALDAAGGILPSDELGRGRRALAHERQETATALARLAQVAGVSRQCVHDAPCPVAIVRSPSD